MTGYSFTEVEAVLTKAARGNGAGVAHASRFGKAAALCLCEDNGMVLVNDALADLPGGVIFEYASRLQNDLAHASGKTLALPKGDPLWVGYIVSLPYTSEQCADGSFTVLLDTFNKPVRPPRLYIEEENMSHWQALAAKTYVPETEQSRIAGAGAGLMDND